LSGHDCKILPGVHSFCRQWRRELWTPGGAPPACRRVTRKKVVVLPAKPAFSGGGGRGAPQCAARAHLIGSCSCCCPGGRIHIIQQHGRWCAHRGMARQAGSRWVLRRKVARPHNPYRTAEVQQRQALPDLPEPNWIVCIIAFCLYNVNSFYKKVKKISLAAFYKRLKKSCNPGPHHFLSPKRLEWWGPGRACRDVGRWLKSHRSPAGHGPCA
jgi:hypothetical protein